MQCIIKKKQPDTAGCDRDSRIAGILHCFSNIVIFVDMWKLTLANVLLLEQIANVETDKVPLAHPMLLIICRSPVTYWAFTMSDLMGAYNCQKFDLST